MASNDSRLKTYQRWSLLVAVAGLVLCGVLSWGDPNRLWRAYLFAFLASWLVTMGGMGLLAIGNLTGGRWAAAARPCYLAEMQVLPLVAILFIPIALSIQRIYPWSGEHPGLTLPPSKEIYLSDNFFYGRAIGYFAVWLVVAWMLAHVNQVDLTPASTSGMRRVGALSLVLLAPTTTFAAFDWAMSLEPEWYSSIYGAVLSASGVLAAHGLAIIALAMLYPFGDRALKVAIAEVEVKEPATEVTEKSVPAHIATKLEDEPAAEVFNDLGNLLLAFVMVFAYFAFSQFLIIWSGNLPKEIAWYLLRLSHGWQWMALAIALLMFFVPFLNLLSRDAKRSPWQLARIATLLVVMHVIHTYWAIVPAFDETGFTWQLTNLAALVTLAAGWLAAVLWHACHLEVDLQSTATDSTEAGI